ncbi:MAG TPA: transposase [Ktedonosporobacter sp.]|nr:transposase [Ktedonosporobacter sp.]
MSYLIAKQKPQQPGWPLTRKSSGSRRDRGGDYASAATLGAPQAVQCADKFHLLKNLGETLEGLLAHHLAKERKRQAQTSEQKQPPVWSTKRAPRYSPKLQQLQRARREERLARYEQVIALHQQGMSQTAIACQVVNKAKSSQVLRSRVINQREE